ncbi:uncharacterized protein LOC106466591 isoform X1 [Limulus polyphemus]|uniref:Uncharacterized protein LOC106466591 isoform X1 n=1 Tax=Limulus polyphemus TaxID=6850 RepID=A0ABM1BHW9_LIMPO|nr:uncharacterized protein LOC106466591 isoform X1 [Limulus polyphemus]
MSNYSSQLRLLFIFHMSILAVLSSTDSNLDLKCPECWQLHCWPRRTSQLRCKGGLTLGVCNCCPVCAKQEGQTCGGENNYLGKCDLGLQCEPQTPEIYHYRKNDIHQIYTITKGTCKKVPPDQLPAQEAHSLFCEPKCSSSFCLQNPRAICSARYNAEKKQECQGACQHTSCRACEFVEGSTCTKCSPDDFRCLRRFGKCIRRDSCSKKKFPCRAKYFQADGAGKFLCKVPECVNS